MSALRFAYRNSEGSICLVLAAPLKTLAHIIGTPVVSETGEVTGYMLTEQTYRNHVIERSIPADAADLVEIPVNYVVPSREERTVEWLQKLKKTSKGP